MKSRKDNTSGEIYNSQGAEVISLHGDVAREMRLASMSWNICPHVEVCLVDGNYKTSCPKLPKCKKVMNLLIKNS